MVNSAFGGKGERKGERKNTFTEERIGMKNTDRGYFERFSFGDSPEMADELLALVLAGKKTGNSFGILEDEQAPKRW